MSSLFTLVVLAAGAALRLWAIHSHPQIQGDSLVYGDIATNWLTHGIYGHSVGHPSGLTTIEPTLVRLPGYPAFLALCFAAFGVANYHAVLYLQALIGPRHLPARRRLGRQICGPRAGRIALLLAALCPSPQVTSPPRSPNAFHLLRRAGLSRPRRGAGAPPPPVDSSAHFFLELCRSASSGRRLLAVVLWTALIVYGRKSLGFQLRSPPCHHCRTALAAPICGLDSTQPAHLSRLSTACAALRQRSRRIRLSRLCALDQNPDRRLHHHQ